jgi:hypothetical protein
MTPLNVISLQQAKDYLVIDYPDRDQEITRLIETAIAQVEQYTCYRLYEREETFFAYGYCTNLPYCPIVIDSVKNSDGDTVNYTETANPLAINLLCKPQSIITATVGYSDISDIPPPLIQAAYKLITYLADNKDMYTVQLPVDVQMLLNQWRRSATI